MMQSSNASGGTRYFEKEIQERGDSRLLFANFCPKFALSNKIIQQKGGRGSDPKKQGT